MDALQKTEIPGLSVRNAMTEDIHAIIKIENECNLSPWSLEDYRYEIKKDNSYLIVAEIKNNVSGFLVARFSEVEVDILNIGVTSAYRNLGIGDALLSSLVNKACSMNVESIWLEVRESNAPAVSFYRNRGFKPIQVRMGFYNRPVENAIVMKCDLLKSDLKP